MPGFGEPVIYTRVKRPDASMVAGFQGFGVATVVEAMGPVLGPQCTMSEAVTRRSTRACVAGPALTVASPLADNLTMHAALRHAEAGDVVVVAVKGSYGAQWGELVGRAASARGVVGAVIEGAVRDVDALDELGFPVWASAVSPLGAYKASPGWVNCAISCAGVRVEPGDIVVADGDGVVVVPAASAHEIYAVASSREREERVTKEEADNCVLPGEKKGLYDLLDVSGVRIVNSSWSEA